VLSGRKRPLSQKGDISERPITGERGRVSPRRVAGGKGKTICSSRRRVNPIYLEEGSARWRREVARTARARATRGGRRSSPKGGRGCGGFCKKASPLICGEVVGGKGSILRPVGERRSLSVLREGRVRVRGRRASRCCCDGRPRMGGKERVGISGRDWQKRRDGQRLIKKELALVRLRENRHGGPVKGSSREPSPPRRSVLRWEGRLSARSGDQRRGEEGGMLPIRYSGKRLNSASIERGGRCRRRIGRGGRKRLAGAKGSIVFHAFKERDDVSLDNGKKVGDAFGTARKGCSPDYEGGVGYLLLRGKKGRFLAARERGSAGGH